MASFTIDQVLTATCGLLLMRGVCPRFTGVATDTRQLQPGDLFVALRGENSDGHAYLGKARELGAAGALVQDEIPGVNRHREKDGPWNIIEVTDTLYALGELAALHRNRFTIPVIGITGSAGKTTTKEMTAAILEARHAVLKSAGNFNNEIGLPLTLFRLEKSHELAVVEFGMRGRGQISYLASIARPTIGVITNIGLTHMELLGSQEEIALAKAELLDEMTAESIAVLPMAGDFSSLLREHAPGRIVTFGEEAEADISAHDILLDDEGRARFTLRSAAGEATVRMGAAGRHQVSNALASAAAALLAGATLEDIQAGLAAYQSAQGRMQIRRSPRGFTVIDDTYNANPTAMRATLQCLKETAGNRKIAILGDMRELGPDEREIHREIGREAMALGIDTLIAIGELGKEYVAGARDARALWVADHETAAHEALQRLGEGDVVLVKGSRAMEMERVVGVLVGGGG